METLESMPFRAERSIWDKLLAVADVTLSKEERELYDIALKHYRDYNNTIDYAKEEGREKVIRPVEKKAGMKPICLPS